MRTTRLLLTVLLCMMLVPTAVPAAGGAPMVIDRFSGDVQEATLDFSKGLFNSSLAIEVPAGATILSAELTLEGVGGWATPGRVLNFANGTVGTDVWAFWNEGQGIYPPTVVPGNHQWTAANIKEIATIRANDGRYWNINTQDPTAGKPPYAYPIQLFRFKPGTAGATDVTVTWEGYSNCGTNQTKPFHAEMWLYNHTDKEWVPVTDYSGNGSDESDDWMNYTFDLPSPFVANDGSIDVAIVGSHSLQAGIILPAFDEGHLYTDYIEVNVTSTGGIQYPQDVTLMLDETAVTTLPGNLTDPVIVGTEHDLAQTLQAVLDGYAVEPRNVSIDCVLKVGTATTAKVNVSDLRIEYEPVVNVAPSYIGPASVEVPEDGGWTTVMDLDAAFDDDHNNGLLEFGLPELVDPPFGDPPYPVGFRFGTSITGNETLEVRTDVNYYTLEPLNVSLRATDLFGEHVDGLFQLTVAQRPDRPELDDETTLEASERVTFSHTFTAYDPDLPDDVLTFSDDSDYFDVDPSTGELVWTPAPDQIGRHEFLLTVTDRFGLTDKLSVTITVKNSNDAPSITSELEMDATQDVSTYYTIRSYDPDVPFGDTLHYFAFADAISLEVDQSTGRVTFTPTNDHVPSFEITIRVEDALGEADEAVLVVSVANVNDPPVFEDYDELVYDQNQPVTFQLVAYDPDLDLEPPLTDSITFTGSGPEMFLPDGDGLVTFTAGQSMVGTHSVTYSVRDQAGLMDVVTVKWTIRDVNDAPVIGTDLPDAIDEDSPFSFTMGAVDADGDALTWSDDTDLFDIDGATGAISFTPTQAQVGTHTITITVSDGKGGVTMYEADLEVRNVNDDPMITVVTPASGSAFDDGKGIELRATATDEDGDALTYTWRLGSKVLGTGNSLTVDDLSPGKHTITLEVTDPNGGSATYDLEVEVRGSEGLGIVGPLLIVVIIAVVVVAALLARRRSAAPEATPTEPPAAEAPVQSEEEVVLSYELDSATAVESDGMVEGPGLEPPEGTGSDGATVHTAEEAPLYKLEDAPEFRVNDTGVEPEE